MLPRPPAFALTALALIACALGPPLAAQTPAPALPRILADPPPGVVLPDFSTAGYHWGEEAPPRVVAGETVLRPEAFGAVPDDGRDDTAALQATFAAAHAVRGPVAVALPRGRLELRDIVYVERDSLVVRGEGATRSELYVPVPLRDMTQNAVLDSLRGYAVTEDKRETMPDGSVVYYSPFSWTGGVLWTRLPPGTRTVRVVGPASGGARGGRDLSIDGDVAVGDVFRVEWFNRDGPRGGLLEHIYGFVPDAEAQEAWRELWEAPDRPIVWQDVTVVAVGPDGRVRVKEPLLHDLRPEWAPRAVRVPALVEVGFEDFAVVFPNVPHLAHHVEDGYNAFFLNDLRHSWVRGVRIENADAGLLHENCAHGTVEDVVVGGRGGHYGLHFGSVNGMLATGVTVTARAVHALSVNTGSTGTVVHQSTAIRGPIDQHKGANHQNLFDAVTLVLSPEQAPLALKSGGAPLSGPRHGAGSTLWNLAIAVETDTPEETPADTVRVLGVGDESRANVVGLHAYLATYTGYGSQSAPVAIDVVYAGYRESVGQAVSVPSLYAYQLRQRLERERAGLIGRRP